MSAPFVSDGAASPPTPRSPLTSRAARAATRPVPTTPPLAFSRNPSPTSRPSTLRSRPSGLHRLAPRTVLSGYKLGRRSACASCGGPKQKHRPRDAPRAAAICAAISRTARGEGRTEARRAARACPGTTVDPARSSWQFCACGPRPAPDLQKHNQQRPISSAGTPPSPTACYTEIPRRHRRVLESICQQCTVISMSVALRGRKTRIPARA